MIGFSFFKARKKATDIMQWLFRIWRPYGDSNPGYRRERAMS